MDALDAGADDMKSTDDLFRIFTAPNNMTSVRDALQKDGYDLETAEVTMIPENKTKVPADKVKQYKHLIDELDANDDVADVYEAGFIDPADDTDE